MSKRTFDTVIESFRAGGGVPDSDDPMVWNSLRADNVLKPKVFLCKAGLFLEKLNDKMGGDGVVKERFGPEDFQTTCDPKHLGKHIHEAGETVAAAADGKYVCSVDHSQHNILRWQTQNTDTEPREVRGTI